VSASAGAGRIVRIAAFALSLAGCAAPAASSKGHALQYASGSTRTEAFRAANKTCNAYGRAAAAAVYDGAARLLTFRCIEP
jgi:hypothetical protein